MRRPRDLSNQPSRAFTWVRACRSRPTTRTKVRRKRPSARAHASAKGERGCPGIEGARCPLQKIAGPRCHGKASGKRAFPQKPAWSTHASPKQGVLPDAQSPPNPQVRPETSLSSGKSTHSSVPASLSRGPPPSLSCVWRRSSAKASLPLRGPRAWRVRCTATRAARARPRTALPLPARGLLGARCTHTLLFESCG